MYLGQSNQPSVRSVCIGTEPRHATGARVDGTCARTPRRLYQERETGTGYGRSSGYANSDAYSGSKRYLDNTPQSLFRFS